MSHSSNTLLESTANPFSQTLELSKSRTINQVADSLQPCTVGRLGRNRDSFANHLVDAQPSPSLNRRSTFRTKEYVTSYAKSDRKQSFLTDDASSPTTKMTRTLQ